MKTAQHTPGPWIYYPDGNAICVVKTHVLKVIADADFGHVDIPEREANARLIAAAPDLLAALDMLAGWVDANREPEVTSEGQQAAWILETARAAIAKATGGA